MRRALVTVAVVVLATLSASAQRFGGGRFSPGIPPVHPYDGSFTFARLYYSSSIRF